MLSKQRIVTSSRDLQALAQTIAQNGKGAPEIVRIKNANRKSILPSFSKSTMEPAFINFSKALKDNTSITALVLENDKINEDGIIALANALEVNKSLKALYIYQTLTEKAMQAIANAMLTNMTLGTLYMSSLDATYSEIIQTLTKASFERTYTNEFKRMLVRKYLLDNPNATTLDCSNDNHGEIGQNEVLYIVNFLKEKDTILQRLSLQNCQISNLGMKLLANALIVNKTLEKLDVSNNEMGNQGVASLASALKENQTLTTIDLGSNLIGVVGIEKLANALIVNKSLKNLDVSNNEIGNQGVESLASALKENQTLTSLHLGSNLIGDVGIEKLANALIVNESLTNLDVSNNNIGNQGLKVLIDALKQNQTITNLNLNDNKSITYTGIDALVDFSITNTSLAHLYVNKTDFIETFSNIKKIFETSDVVDFTNKSITNVKSSMIASILMQDKTVIELNLSSNQIGDDGIEKLANALRVNNTLENLDVSNNGIGDKGVESLANALKENKTLTSIDLGSNQIANDGIEKLANALIVNKTLTKLDVSNNDIGVVGAGALVEALPYNDTLKTLILTNNFISSNNYVTAELGTFFDKVKSLQFTTENPAFRKLSTSIYNLEKLYNTQQSKQNQVTKQSKQNQQTRGKVFDFMEFDFITIENFLANKTCVFVNDENHIFGAYLHNVTVVTVGSNGKVLKVNNPLKSSIIRVETTEAPIFYFDPRLIDFIEQGYNIFYFQTGKTRYEGGTIYVEELSVITKKEKYVKQA